MLRSFSFNVFSEIFVSLILCAYKRILYIDVDVDTEHARIQTEGANILNGNLCKRADILFIIYQSNWGKQQQRENTDTLTITVGIGNTSKSIYNEPKLKSIEHFITQNKWKHCVSASMLGAYSLAVVLAFGSFFFLRPFILFNELFSLQFVFAIWSEKSANCVLCVYVNVGIFSHWWMNWIWPCLFVCLFRWRFSYANYFSRQYFFSFLNV